MMKNAFLFIAVVVMGCGKQAPQTQPETKPESSKPKVEAEIPTNAFVNTLGMPFVPVPGAKVQFCIWETRVKDYVVFAADNAGVEEKWKSPGYPQTDTHPVVKVNWNDAQAFCTWLTKKEMKSGKLKVEQQYRLPTDAEWSVAVGLGKETGNSPREKDIEGAPPFEKKVEIENRYPWGNEWPPPKGAGNYHEDQAVDSYKYTSPVGSFVANRHDLHDMGGNVREWCEDWYDLDINRVMRGACFIDGGLQFLLSSCRYAAAPDRHGSNVGFRCVLTSE